MQLQQVVDMWIEQYKSNREHALVQLMQFFINSSGCRGKVSPDMAQMDHTLIIKKMTQEFDEVPITILLQVSAEMQPVLWAFFRMEKTWTFCIHSKLFITSKGLQYFLIKNSLWLYLKLSWYIWVFSWLLYLMLL